MADDKNAVLPLSLTEVGAHKSAPALGSESAMAKPLKRHQPEKRFSEVIKGLKRCEFDFNPDHYLDQLVAEFKSNRSRCCDWCLVDAIYMSNSETLLPFFTDLLTGFGDCYQLDTAIDWLIRQNTDEARARLWVALPQHLCDERLDIRLATIRGLRHLDTNEALMLLWETRNQCPFPSEKDTSTFQSAIDDALARPPQKRSFHAIP